jgi:hypothetical protein
MIFRGSGHLGPGKAAAPVERVQSIVLHGYGFHLILALVHTVFVESVLGAANVVAIDLQSFAIRV